MLTIMMAEGVWTCDFVHSSVNASRPKCSYGWAMNPSVRSLNSTPRHPMPQVFEVAINHSASKAWKSLYNLTSNGVQLVVRER